MKCKLCLQEKPLLKKSHIIPNFAYKELRDNDNSFIMANLKDGTGKVTYTGLFESNILCKKCDNILLGQLEHYGCSILYGGKMKGVTIINETNQNNIEWTRGSGVDYTKFKLFLLSILWRFSISSKDFYRFVDLGKHEEIIRQMIINKNASDELDYPCFISSYRKHRDLPFQIISQPLKHRNNGGICYSVLISGLLYTFFMSKKLTPKYLNEIVLNKKNEIKIVNIKRSDAIKIIEKYCGFNPFT